MISDPIEEFLVDLYNTIIDDWRSDRIEFCTGDLAHMLEQYGLMIVPIEDPTNLFGVMEDSV